MKTEKGVMPFHDWLVRLRRYFHQFPELAYREEDTASKIAEVLREMGVPFDARVGRTGLVARLAAERPGPVLAMRADMDALPLEESSDVPYRSRNPGVMHACGHYAHMTIALGVIRRLLEEDWPRKGRGRILFIFQPAEEGGAGARAMIESGFLDAEPVEAVFAGHMYPELPLGHIGLSREAGNAACDTLFIRLTGKGGHGAHPELCIDPIVAGAYLVGQLQSIVSRSISPLESAVLTIGRFHAGTANNIIPQQAELEGTLRTLKPNVRETVLARLHEMLNGLQAAYGVSAQLEVSPGYPVLVNDPGIVEFVHDRGAGVLGKDCVHLEPPSMGAEDFAYFLERFPGALIRIGCHDPEKGYSYGLHSPYFDLDERVLEVGVRLFTELLTSYALT